MLRETLHRWQNNLTASMFTGAEGLGVYLAKQDVTLVKVQKNLSGTCLMESRQLPYDPDNLEGLLPELQETVAAWHAVGSPVYLTVSTDLAFLQPGSLPAAAAENLAQVVGYELDRFLPLPAAQLYFDFQIIGRTETELNLMFLAIPRPRVERWLALLKEVSLKPVGLTVAPVAAAQAFNGAAGAQASTSRLVLRTQADGFALTWLEGAVIRSFFQKRGLTRKDFFPAVQQQLDGKVDKGATAPMLCIYGEARGDIVNRLLEKYEFDVVPPAEDFAAAAPGPGDGGRRLTAFGAAVLGLGKPALGPNLLPPAEREPVSFKTFALHNILVVSLLTLVLLWAGSALVHKRFRLFQVNRQIAQLTPEAREVENLLKEGRTLADQMRALHTIGASPDKLVVLKNLTQLIPNNTWLYSVRLSKQVLEISGTSQSASELIPLLEKSGWLQKTEFVSPIVTDANKNEQFKIKAEIKSLDPAS